MVFLFLMIVVFGCLGMQLYGNQMNFQDDDGRPRHNFDDFLYAFYTLFQVLTASAWELVMFDCMRAHKNGNVAGFLYIMVFFVLSNYIILNLFIGAILANMGNNTDSNRVLETLQMKEVQLKAQKLTLTLTLTLTLIGGSAESPEASPVSADLCQFKVP